MVARDPERIDDVLVALGAYWRANPDLRLCQIVGWFLSDEHAPTDIAIKRREPPMSTVGFNTEDHAFLRWLKVQNLGGA